MEKATVTLKNVLVHECTIKKDTWKTLLFIIDETQSNRPQTNFKMTDIREVCFKLTLPLEPLETDWALLDIVYSPAGSKQPVIDTGVTVGVKIWGSDIIAILLQNTDKAQYIIVSG